MHQAQRTISAALLTPMFAAAACATGQPSLTRQSPDTGSRPSPRPATIVMDGSTDDWPGVGPVRLASDAEHLWVRFDPDNTGPAIQAAPFSTRILIDADDNPETGRPVGALGVDAMATLSPPFGGGIGNGSEVILYDGSGNGTVTGHAALNFFFLPTYASHSYEARLDRSALGSLTTSRRVSVRVDQVDADGDVLWSGNARGVMPAFNPQPSDAALPTTPKNGLRLLAQNVLFSSPLQHPDAFERMITAIDPDIILFQEWFNTPEIVIQTWFNTNLGPGWNVVAPSPNEGLAIATRLPVTDIVPDLIDVPGGRTDSRFLGAMIDTPVGPFFGASVHLKCCGGADSSEDQRRISEAISINATVAAVLQAHPDAAVAIAGDYNLVGTRTPLDIIRVGLASDGGDLTPAETLTLGDPAAVTWIQESSRFSPGRLDWAVVDETRTAIARAFTLDTRRLSAASLLANGLEPEDSQASDHLPLVVDLLARD
ncbi:MAG: endonuclease/exonuclease/phosphatase family protein [Planctomycetota bacterium]